MDTFLALNLHNSPVFEETSVCDWEGSFVAFVDRDPIVLKLKIVTGLMENL
jgi:hypothetical protein